MPTTLPPDAPEFDNGTGDEDFDVIGEFGGGRDDAPTPSPMWNPRQWFAAGGITLALMILTALGFVAGLVWGASRDMGGDEANLVWDIVIHIGVAVGAGALGAIVVLAIGALALGIPYARRQRRQRG